MKRAWSVGISIAVVAIATSWGAASSAPSLVRLPSMEATIEARIRAEQLLRGGRGPERTLPGRVSDQERVRVEVSPAGAAQRVVVDQRLDVRGVGDYFVKIPGPVESASALPDSTAEPGVRSGSLIWQGFASDGETLAARVGLLPQHERARLPLQVSVMGEAGGEPLDIGARVDGRIELEVSVVNRTGVRLELPTGEPQPGSAPSALAAARRVLQRRGRPVPGTSGIPEAIPASRLATRSEVVSAPLSVRVTVSFRGGVENVRARGAQVKEGARITVLRSALLSGDHLRLDVPITAVLHSGTIDVSVTARPAPPPSSEAIATGDEGTTLDRLVSVLAEVARLPEVDGYLGNPDRDGPSSTTYSYRVVEQRDEAEGPGPNPEPQQTSWVGVALVVLLFVAAGGGVIVWWALS